MTNYYETLGVEKDASTADIKSAFKNLAKKHHPDVGGDETKFHQINEAYETLSNPKKRQEYDNPMSGGFPGGFSSAMDEMFNDFGHFFGGGNHGFHQNINASLQVKLTLEEIAKGVSKDLDIRINDKDETLNIKIPAGLQPNGRIVYRGKGLEGPHGRGDLYVDIVQIDHPRFQRNGNDIYSMEEIDVWDAMLGCEKLLTTVNEKNIKYKIKPGIQPHDKIKLAGQGIQNGSHYIIIKISVPTRLTESQKHNIIDLKQTFKG